MSSVYYPAHVVLVLRRIVNLISTLSISNNYLLPKSTITDTDRGIVAHSTVNAPLSVISSSPFVRHNELWWPWSFRQHDWNWISLRLLSSTTIPQESMVTSLAEESSSSRSLKRQWSWRSLLTTSAQTASLPDMEDPPPTPPPPPPQRKQEEAPNPSPLLPHHPPLPDTIHQLMQNPPLYNPLRTPRYPIALCHGLYGFDSRGPTKFPSLRMHYWSNVLNILRDTVRAEVIVTSVPGTGSISSRAETLDRQLQIKARGRGINLIAHSMGGLDCRHLITHLKPDVYAPLSLTTISTPHRGSPFMDWCVENIGIGKLNNHNEHDPANTVEPRKHPSVIPSPIVDASKPKLDSSLSISLGSLPSSFTTLLLSVMDTPAYANLTSAFLDDIFNPATPDDPTVKYFSVAGRIDTVSIWHPFWFTKMVLDSFEEKHRARLRAAWQRGPVLNSSKLPLWAQEREWGNDGLVTIQSAKWGEFLGIMEGCDHWEMRGARGLEFGVDLPALPVIGLGVSTSGHRSPTMANDGWTLPDWVRFMGTWKREQSTQPNPVIKAVTGSSAERELQREEERAKDDAVVKSSTDKFSAVLDWLTDQVPTASLRGSKAIADLQARAVEAVTVVKGGPISEQKRTVQDEKERKRNELETKKDLERFYVALSRKLYDEGF